METSTLRARARASLTGSWGLSIAVAVIACLMGGLITGASFLPEVNTELPISFPALQEVLDRINQGVRIGGLTIRLQSGILGIVPLVLGGVLQLGYARFLLKQHDGKQAEFNDLFSEFDRFGTGFAQMFLCGLYTMLWSLLFIIPGIIAALSYSMTPFILAEHPDMTASEAIERSKDLMNGHKTELFLLDLSFIGWVLLSVLTLNLGHLLLNPYMNAAYAAFYREIVKQERQLLTE